MRIPTLQRLFEQHPLFSIYTIGAQVSMSLRAPNEQLMQLAESCRFQLDRHVQQVMRQIFDTAMPPHYQLTRSVGEKHHPEGIYDNEEQVCFSKQGPFFNANEARKAVARVVRDTIDSKDQANALISALYEPGVSELLTYISLRRNESVSHTPDVWKVELVHTWKTSSKSISFSKTLIQQGLVRVVHRLDPRMIGISIARCQVSLILCYSNVSDIE